MVHYRQSTYRNGKNQANNFIISLLSSFASKGILSKLVRHPRVSDGSLLYNGCQVLKSTNVIRDLNLWILWCNVRMVPHSCSSSWRTISPWSYWIVYSNRSYRLGIHFNVLSLLLPCDIRCLIIHCYMHFFIYMIVYYWIGIPHSG